MEGNFEWFKEHYDEIYTLCGECYVIIKDKKIIAIFHDISDAYNYLVENSLLGNENLQYCNGDESAYTSYCFLSFE